MLSCYVGAMFGLLALSVALALDAAAVSASLGATAPRERVVAAVLLFGAFQAAMAGIGAVGGELVATYAASVDHWIAFALLALVGGRMIWGTGDDDEGPETTWWALVVLAVATSIDALAAGVTLPLMGPPLPVCLVAIGGVTSALSGLAAILGRGVGATLGPHVERLGGVVLIGIGLKILVEHLAT